MKRYIARAPVTVVCDRRPGDTFEAAPKDVLHLVEMGHVEPVDDTEYPPESGMSEAGDASGAPPAGAPAGRGPGAKAKAAKKPATKKPAK